MAFLWKGLCDVAKTAWNFAAPLLGSIAGESVKQVGNDLTGQISEQNFAALNFKKKQLDEEVFGMEKKFQTLQKEFQYRQSDFSEKQRKLDDTAEQLLREQESLKRAEAELENRQMRTDNTRKMLAIEHCKNAEKQAIEHCKNAEKQVAEVRECLSQELARYEKAQDKLIKKQNENDREYAKHQQRLKEAYETLKQNQSQIINLVKTLPAIQKVKELHALTDVFMHNCEVFADEPDAMVDETKIMQRNYTIKLMEVRNVMVDGYFFPGSMRVWADGAVLDLHMLGFLVAKGLFGYSVVEHAKNNYQGYWDKLKGAHTRHRQVARGSDRLQEIEYLLEKQFSHFDTLMIRSRPSASLPPALGPPEEDVFQSSSSRAFGAARNQSDRSLSRRHSESVREKEPRRRPSSPGKDLARRWDAGPSTDADRLLILEQKCAGLERSGRYDGHGTNAWDLSGQQPKTSRSSSRMLAAVPSSGGSAHNHRSTLESGRREKHSYSQDHQEYGTGFSSSRNQQEPEQNRQEPLHFDDQQDFQGSRQQQYRGGQNVAENRQPSRQKYQARSHSPDDQQESSEESGSSSDDQVSEHEAKGRNHLSRDKREALQKCSGKVNSNNEQVYQQSDDSENNNFTKRNTTNVLHKSGGRRHSDMDQQVNQDWGNYSMDRQGQGTHHSSTKKKTNQMKTLSRDPK